jgi:DNA-binding beta-propeller fold protein YncE
VYLLPGGNAAKNISLPFPPLVSPAGIFVNASNKDVYVAGDSQVVRIPGGTGTPIALPLPALTPIFGAWSEARDVFQDARGTLWVTNFAHNYGTPSVVAIPAAAPSFYLVPTAYTWVCPHSITVSSDGTM